MQKITMREVQTAVCKYYNLDLGVMLGEKRYQYITKCRHVAMYLCRELIGYSYPQISLFFRKKDHTTSMHAHKKITQQLKNDKNLQSEILDILEKINQNGNCNNDRKIYVDFKD